MTGKVYLVGAGPGDPGLITLKGLQCLRDATVVIYDRLINHRLLAESADHVERVYAGKKPGDKALEQDEINDLMVCRAKAGHTVVRLQGGDPFIFGRGGEEVQALAQAGVPFEVVPGITSAIAAPAYAGIPLTHRKLASSFTVVSGDEDPTKGDSGINWDALAHSGGTLVVLMGWKTKEGVVASLMEAGMAPSTPAALVQWGSTPNQRTVVGTLGSIVQEGVKAGLSSPVVAVIGEVVGLHEAGNWFEKGPLFGKKVLVTRSRSQASALSGLLSKEGAQPLELPAIEVSAISDNVMLDRALTGIGAYDWTIFTSANAVSIFFGRMKELAMDSRRLGGIKVAAIGTATAAALRDHGIAPDILPMNFSSQGLIEAMADVDLAEKRVLLPRGDLADDRLTQGLQGFGACIDDIKIYRTAAPDGSAEKARALLSDNQVDVAAFTSSSTVVNLLKLLDGDGTVLKDVDIGCIGPVTAATAKECGLDVDFIAEKHTIPGLLEALRNFYSQKEEG